LCGDLCDPATHGAGADEPDPFVVHCHLMKIFAG
jgi:hypothetical protein